ncbi:MAG TPA: terminase family protein [Roseiarcus sp.]|nr:terminase family protein [Roseiarcus sp.]
MKRARRPLKTLFAELLAGSPAQRQKQLARLTAQEAAELYYDWSLWARPDQIAPEGDWIYWLILAGRGAGKTRAGAETVRAWARAYPIVNLIGATRQDAREIMVMGESGLLAICPPQERPRFARGADRLEWPNGAISQIFSAEEPDRLRGKQHMKLWLDELAAWRDPDAFDQAMLGLRLGDKPQAVVTTTPRPTRLIKQLLDSADAVVSRGSTFDNARFLADGFLTRIAARFDGRAIGRQELYGEIIEEAPGALWTRALIERQRLPKDTPRADYVEIVIGVDPPARSGAKADECGIIAVGRTAAGVIHVLADLSSQGETPGEWSARVVSGFRRYEANRIVAEINNGGEMVAQVMRQHDPNLPVRSVTATRGKFLRAEPIAAAYERGAVFHLGGFEKLEDQLCTLTSDFDSRTAGFSPDRADALVWAVADLIAPRRASPSDMLDLYAREMKGE